MESSANVDRIRVMSTVHVVRRKNYANGVLIRFAVRIDGAVVAKLWNGRSVTRKIDPGTHTIQITNYPGKSELVTFSVGTGGTASFECGPNVGGGMGILVDLLKRQPTLNLTRTS
jgi:hypothetical protein